MGALENPRNEFMHKLKYLKKVAIFILKNLILEHGINVFSMQMRCEWFDIYSFTLLRSFLNFEYICIPTFIV
jgi:hypothetical protein